MYASVCVVHPNMLSSPKVYSSRRLSSNLSLNTSDFAVQNHIPHNSPSIVCISSVRLAIADMIHSVNIPRSTESEVG